MTSRNRLLADGVRDNAQLSGLRAGHGRDRRRRRGGASRSRRRDGRQSSTSGARAIRIRAFPWSSFRLEGRIEDDLQRLSAVEAEDAYARTLSDMRERDRAAGRTLDGPHRSDLLVAHGPKALPARHCSTGEQKALLLGLVLAHAELLTERQEGAARSCFSMKSPPISMPTRRAALFAEILRLGAQAWMTGTDEEAFAGLSGRARFWRVEEGRMTLLDHKGSEQGQTVTANALK